MDWVVNGGIFADPENRGHDGSVPGVFGRGSEVRSGEGGDNHLRFEGMDCAFAESFCVACERGFFAERA